MPTFLSRKHDIDEISNSELLLTRSSKGQQVEMFSRTPSFMKINVYQPAEDDSSGKDEHLRKPGHFAAGSCNPFITHPSKLNIVSPFYFAHLVFFFCLSLLFSGSMKPSSSAATSWISFSRNGEICATVPSSTGNENVPALQLEPTAVHDNCQKRFLSAQLWFMSSCVHLGFESKNQAQLWLHCTCFAYDAQTRLPCSSIHDSTNQKLV